ncbi:MAG: LpqB family beta-propeller domain-containing protein, partial [Actinobacteria bacterium]|nr:LpqB family beta-propeller domain-containing protein [Actinomycetota bacterium]
PSGFRVFGSVTLAVTSLAVIAAFAIAACGGTAVTAAPQASPGATGSPSAEPPRRAAPLPTPTVAGTIAFAKVRAAGSLYSDICVVRSDGAQLKTVTGSGSYRALNPAWSPDGSTIAFTALGPLDGGAATATLAVMRADGAFLATLINDHVQGDGAAWSPDGTRIAFARSWSTGRAAIFVIDDGGTINVDAADLRRVTRPAAGTRAAAQADRSPVWAPDGRILFLRSGDVFAVDPDGSGLTALTDVGSIAEFALSPDGRRIAICDSKRDRVVVMALHGGGHPVTLLEPVSDYAASDGPSRDATLAWAPDGKALALATSAGLYIVNVDGSGLSAVPGVGAALDPAWRPE